MASSGIEPAAFRLVAYGKNNLMAFTAAERFNFDEFISGGLHEKDAVVTWNFGTISAFA
jgi:hypothetical protein